MPDRHQVALDFIRHRARKRVLVISNCQTFGLVSVMKSAADQFDVIGVPITEVATKPDDYFVDAFGAFHHLFVVFSLQRLTRIPALAPKVTIIPAITFDGYHPDCVYLKEGSRQFDSPLGGYHSCIALAAFRAGYSSVETERLFNTDVYRAVGYFDQWQIAKIAMFRQFSSMGFSAEDHFYRWCARGAFMHSINHPRIEVLEDLGRDMLRRIGCDIEARPHTVCDDLSKESVFPVYPDIAAVTGAIGSYRFKPSGSYDTLGLSEFIALSFEGYRNAARDDLVLHPAYGSRLNTVTAAICPPP